ncbi:MAG: MltA domain-containing protein [Rhodospirillales bacterium]|nr:MltA domain-containing protein [Rhodospirillales bacterium]
MQPWIALLCLALALTACERNTSEPDAGTPPALRPSPSHPSPSHAPLSPAPVEAAGGAFGLTRVDYALLPGWPEDDPSGAIAAFRRSCAVLFRRPASAAVGPEGRYGRTIDWRPACAALGEPEAYDAPAARRYFEIWFQPYMVASRGRSEGLFTGYYEVEVKGALQPGGDYRWPLYRPPSGAITVSGTPDRAAIEAGALKGKGLELAWLDDPVDVFDLHIQGSARMSLPDGSYRRIGYAGTNGLPYVGIGRLMLDRGHIGPDRATAQGVKAWLKDNPEEARALMQENPRYVFFRWIEGDGPVGAQGVPLTAGRSLAVDPAFIGYGMPLFLETTHADGAPLRRLTIAQDTGAAIKGPVRGDLFWGTGAAALDLAGGMKQKGRYYLFLPRTLTVALAAN